MTTKFDQIQDLNNVSSSGPRKEGEFEWTHNQQTLFLASYFYGYASFKLIGGYIAFVFGFHKLLGVTIGLAGLLNLFLPTILKVSTHVSNFLKMKRPGNSKFINI